MGTRLYVGNLSDDASVEALRQRFATCGTVSDVHLATDRSSGRMRGYAFVTMATERDARSAITQLNGVIFDERPLRVNEAGEERGEGSLSKEEKTARDAKRVKITSQFRERLNMAYELDCGGVPLAMKMFPTPTDGGGEEWRVEVRATGVADDATVTASAPTRALAMQEIERCWLEKAAQSTLPAVDWRAIIETMQAVRAL